MHEEKLHVSPKKNRKRKNISGSVHIKKHKQILCSFITKYSATINIAFLSPFHLHLRMLTPRLFSVLNTCKYEAKPLFCHCPVSQGQSSFLGENRLQIQRRKHNTDPAGNKTKKKQEEHKE